MQKRKHKICALATLLLLAALLPLVASCGSAPADDGKITVVCTTFPLYDWTRNVVGDSDTVAVELLVSSGTDLHSFQPSVADVAKISSAELLVHIGGTSDVWVQDAAEQTKDLKVLTLSEADGVTLLSLEGEEHQHTHDEDDHAHGDFDEHIWLSLNNAIACSKNIASAISELDKDNAEKYKANLDKYVEKLTALHREYTALPKEKALLFADRFPFGYLMNDYDIGYFAAFTSCSADTDASFETVVDLAKTIDEQKLTHVLVTESSDKKLAKSIIAETQNKSAEILTLDSMQSVTAADIGKGYTYLAAMESNLEVLKTALN